MPRLANARLVSEMQRKTEAHFYGDSATMLSYVVDSLDVFGQPSTTETLVTFPCSISDKPKLENWKGYADIEQIAVEIRFTSPTPEKGKRITLTGRFDSTDYADKTFEIIGIRDRDALGYVCALMAVQI